MEVTVDWVKKEKINPATASAVPESMRVTFQSFDTRLEKKVSLTCLSILTGSSEGKGLEKGSDGAETGMTFLFGTE